MSQRPAPKEPIAAALIAYAAPAVPFATLTLPLYVFVPGHYAAALGLSIAAVGQALFFVRVFDAVSDPIVGWLADRAPRRKLWLIFSTPAVILAAWMLFRPPPDAGIGYLLGWGMALSAAWTAALVPYGAWGVELSASYAGRARVAAWRESATVVGTLLALVGVALAPSLPLPGPAPALTFFALAVALLLPLFVAAAAIVTPEAPPAPRIAVPTAQALREIAANGPFRRLLAAFFLNGLANGFPATLFVFYATHVLKRGDLAGPFLVLYLAAGVAGVPVWLALARRWSKHRAWAVGMLVACASFPFAMLLGADAVVAFSLVCVATGFTLGADVALPASIQADVIDVDAAQSGAQRAAIYVSLWAFATKLALGLAVGVAFPILGAFGFNPAANVGAAAGLGALAFLYAGAPVLLKLVAVAMVWRFPLDQAEHARLRAVIEAR